MWYNEITALGAQIIFKEKGRSNMKQVFRRLTAAAASAALMLGALPMLPVHAATTLTVGKNGTYKTIGEAVSAAAALNPSGESSRVTIAIEPGTYREQLIINTPYLTFTNSNPNAGEVTVTWYYGIGYQYYSAASSGYYNANDAKSKSKKAVAQRWGTAVRLQKSAQYFRAENITFENSFNRYVTDEEIADGVEPTGETLTVQRRKGMDVTAKNTTERAAAMCVEADYCEFLHCNFVSSQDTLYTEKKAYFKECKIQGNTDYIFGSGDVVFDQCELCFGGYSDNAVGGYITAARQQTLGYLFWECNVTANAGKKVGAGFFGRPWRNTAHVLFYNTKLQYEGIIQSAGWTKMSGVEPSQATFREYNTKTMNGGNVNTGGRVSGTVLSSCSATREQYLNGWTPYYMNGSGSKRKAGARLELSAMSFYLKNEASGLYLGIEGDAKDGANIIQTEKDKACVWIPEGFGEGYYWLYADGGDMSYFNEGYYILSVDGDKTEDGANISIVKQCDGDGKFFKFVSAGKKSYELVTKHTEDQSCVSISTGANVLQSACTGNADQRWIIEEKIDPIKGTLIREMMVYDRTNAQKWMITENAQSGAAMFGDRAFTIVGLPAELQGAELIQTACDSKYFSGTLADVTAAQPLTLYVAMDTRVDPLPAWLSDWTKTALTFDNSDAVHFTCYSKEVEAGETVSLGANGQSSYCVNYIAFAQPRAAETTTVTTTTTTETTATTTTAPAVTTTAAETTAVTIAETTAATVTTTTTGAPAAVLAGDTDCNGQVDVSDAVALARFVAEDKTVQISAAGQKNADCDGIAGITGGDVTQILKIVAKLV